MTDFKEYSGWISAGFATIIGAIGYLYKDYTGKKQKDATLLETQTRTSNEIIERLRQEVKDVRAINAELLEFHKADVKKIDDFTKEVIALKTTIQQQAIDLQLSKLK